MDRCVYLPVGSVQVPGNIIPQGASSTREISLPGSRWHQSDSLIKSMQREESCLSYIWHCSWRVAKITICLAEEPWPQQLHDALIIARARREPVTDSLWLTGQYGQDSRETQATNDDFLWKMVTIGHDWGLGVEGWVGLGEPVSTTCPRRARRTGCSSSPIQ